MITCPQKCAYHGTLVHVYSISLLAYVRAYTHVVSRAEAYVYSARSTRAPKHVLQYVPPTG